jgi:hypothetical protein
MFEPCCNFYKHAAAAKQQDADATENMPAACCYHSMQYVSILEFVSTVVVEGHL